MPSRYFEPVSTALTRGRRLSIIIDLKSAGDSERTSNCRCDCRHLRVSRVGNMFEAGCWDIIGDCARDPSREAVDSGGAHCCNCGRAEGYSTPIFCATSDFPEYPMAVGPRNRVGPPNQCPSAGSIGCCRVPLVTTVGYEDVISINTCRAEGGECPAGGFSRYSRSFGLIYYCHISSL